MQLDPHATIYLKGLRTLQHVEMSVLSKNVVSFLLSRRRVWASLPEPPSLHRC
jgi:hypothetical protein